jgi:hypothetical protein
MRILSFSLKLILLALVATFVVPGCKDDDDAKPDTATIHGTITLQNASLWDTWKDSGDVELSLFSEFVLAPPPDGKGWGYIPVDFFGTGSVDGRYPLSAPIYTDTVTYASGITQIHYEIVVQPKTYSALAIGFRNNSVSDPSKKTATLGVAWDHPAEVSSGLLLKYKAGNQVITIIDDPAPVVLTLAKGDNVEINFTADFGFVEVWPFH